MDYSSVQKSSLSTPKRTKGVIIIKITVCIGSSCHLKGSRQVVEGLQNLIAENKLEDTVTLGAAFCMGRCQPGVSVSVDDEVFSVTPETLGEFFAEQVKAKI